MIAILTPTRDTVQAGFAYDLAQLVKAVPDTVFAVGQGSLLCNLREQLVRRALEAGATHILFIDSDMRFPASTLHTLIMHNLPVVGANVLQKQEQSVFTARKGGNFITSFEQQGLEEVDILGFGVTLISSEVFKKIDEPWFSMPWDSEEKRFIGEDVSFCDKVKTAGFTIHVDHDLSKEVRHCGIVEFGL